jgi:hypothetical protein
VEVAAVNLGGCGALAVDRRQPWRARRRILLRSAAEYPWERRGRRQIGTNMKNRKGNGADIGEERGRWV